MAIGVVQLHGMGSQISPIGAQSASVVQFDVALGSQTPQPAENGEVSHSPTWLEQSVFVRQHCGERQPRPGQVVVGADLLRHAT
jgi:hypothetical protein